MQVFISYSSKVMLRPCQVAKALSNFWAFGAFEDHEGLESEHIRLQLVRAFVGKDRPSMKLDAAFEKHLADLARLRRSEWTKRSGRVRRELQDVREEFRKFGFIADQPKCCRHSDSTRSAP